MIFVLLIKTKTKTDTRTETKIKTMTTIIRATTIATKVTCSSITLACNEI